MGPRPARPARNRAPPNRYKDSTICRGGRIDWPDISDSEDSDEIGSRSRREASPSSGNLAPQRCSSPGSPFHGFLGGAVPVGSDVLDGEPRLSLFPPRRLSWATEGPRPACPAFPQVCRGGSHVHTGRSRVGERRKYVPVVQHPVLAAQPHPAVRGEAAEGVSGHADLGEKAGDSGGDLQNTSQGFLRHVLFPTQEEAGQEQGDRGGAGDGVAPGEAGLEVVQGEEGDSGGDLLNLFLSPTQGQDREDLHHALPPPATLVPSPPPNFVRTPPPILVPSPPPTFIFPPPPIVHPSPPVSLNMFNTQTRGENIQRVEEAEDRGHFLPPTPPPLPAPGNHVCHRRWRMARKKR